MGSEEAKIEKKRQKAQVKAEKARVKAGQQPESTSIPQPQEKIKWYKDPNWIRAIIAIVTLVVMIITLFVAL